MKCLECLSDFSSERGLHLHVSKKHKFSLQEYYSKHFPRFDKFSNEPIKFKNFEEYFLTDFNSKENLANWCFKEDKAIVRDYICKLFKARCNKKKTLFVPSNIELKSLFLPSWQGLVKIFDTKENVIKAFTKQGLRFKYDYISTPTFSDIEPEILIDTREQNPLEFKDSKKMKLSCGDYGTSGPLFSDVFVERKSLEDLISTLVSGSERFDREISRAEDLGYYLVVLIENKFQNALNYSPEKSFSKYINGKFVFHKIREIYAKYNNIQFIFSDSRENSKDIMIKIFQMKESVKKFDLEFLKDFNQI